MNSDNTHIAGLTLDYGPFAWMERYTSNFQPFTSDTSARKYSFEHQAAAMQVNLETLGESVGVLIRSACQNQSESDDDSSCSYTAVDVINYIDEVDCIVKQEVLQNYAHFFEEMVQKKLGIGYFDDEVFQLWTELEVLMTESGVDYTILFRSLSEVVARSAGGIEAVDMIRPAFYDASVLLMLRRSNKGGEGGRGRSEEVHGRSHQYQEANRRTSSSTDQFKDKVQGEGNTLQTAWIHWFQAYAACCQKDPSYATPQERANRMNTHNPKYILRNWMATMAYQQAEEHGDYSLVHEISALLEHPYDEGSEESQLRWYVKTPAWAEGMPGVSFLS